MSLRDKVPSYQIRNFQSVIITVHAQVHTHSSGPDSPNLTLTLTIGTRLTGVIATYSAPDSPLRQISELKMLSVFVLTQEETEGAQEEQA